MKLRVNESYIIAKLREPIERQQAEIMADAARRAAELGAEFDRMIELSERLGKPLGLPETVAC